jgi:hypothetical protein
MAAILPLTTDRRSALTLVADTEVHHQSQYAEETRGAIENPMNQESSTIPSLGKSYQMNGSTSDGRATRLIRRTQARIRADVSSKRMTRTG